MKTKRKKFKVVVIQLLSINVGIKHVITGEFWPVATFASWDRARRLASSLAFDAGWEVEVVK